MLGQTHSPRSAALIGAAQLPRARPRLTSTTRGALNTIIGHQLPGESNFRRPARRKTKPCTPSKSLQSAPRRALCSARLLSCSARAAAAAPARINYPCILASSAVRAGSYCRRYRRDTGAGKSDRGTRSSAEFRRTPPPPPVLDRAAERGEQRRGGTGRDGAGRYGTGRGS